MDGLEGQGLVSRWVGVWYICYVNDRATHPSMHGIAASRRKPHAALKSHLRAHTHGAQPKLQALQRLDDMLRRIAGRHQQAGLGVAAQGVLRNTRRGPHTERRRKLRAAYINVLAGTS